MRDDQVLIVGAGPTGLTVAQELLRRGVPCRIVDKAPHPTTQSRALGVSARSLEILDELGLAEEVIAAGERLDAAQLYSQGRPLARVTAGAVTGVRFRFMLCVPQRDTERILTGGVERLGGRIEREVELASLRQGAGGVEVRLRSTGGAKTERFSWVVGADGAHSAVRKQCGIEFAGRPTGEAFAIADATLDGGPERGVAHYYFSPQGLLVVIPLPDGSYRLAATVRGDEADAPLGPELMQSVVERRGLRGASVGELADAGWPTVVRIHRRLADAFRSGNCLLAGDAAHIHSPVGGQGMNSGLQDAHNLGWKLALVARGQAPPGLLDSYESERRPVARLVGRSTSLQARLASLSSRPGAALRDALIRRAARKGALDRRLAPALAQLNVDYGRSEIVERRGRGSAERMAGRRLPDAELRARSGEPARMLDVVRERELTVLAVSQDEGDEQALSGLRGALHDRYGELVGVRVVVNGAGPAGAGDAGAGGGALHDAGGELHAAVGTGLCVVRPDGHISYQGPLSAPGRLLDHLGAMLGRAAESDSTATRR